MQHCCFLKTKLGLLKKHMISVVDGILYLYRLKSQDRSSKPLVEPLHTCHLRKAKHSDDLHVSDDDDGNASGSPN